LLLLFVCPHHHHRPQPWSFSSRCCSFYLLLSAGSYPSSAGSTCLRHARLSLLCNSIAQSHESNIQFEFQTECLTHATDK
jgi:hypothetical protein